MPSSVIPALAPTRVFDRAICRLIAALAGILMSSAAVAAVTPEAYRNVGVSPPPGAGVPRDATVTVDGRLRSMAELIARPTVLVFADYTCTTLCGPIVAFVAAALDKSGLRAGEQFGLLVVGLDPKDSAADAATMRRDHLEPGGALDKATTFATADIATVQRLTAALGYRYIYDADHDQYVHPGAAYVLRADGRVSRVLTGLGLTGYDMRLALVEASAGQVGSFADQVRLICSGFDPTRGAYNVMVSRLLAITGVATVLALGGLVGVLVLMSRRRVA